MTYNIRYDNPKDSSNNWEHRKEFLLSQLNYYSPDIIGTQEGLEHQVKWLDENLIDYNYVGVGRADVKEKGKGEFSAVYYNTKKLKKIFSNTFWLSETPDKPSRGWDASLNRICTYLLLEDKENGNKFWVFNTHFDHKGKFAREKSAELILSKIKSINVENLPVILMGDFNLTPNELPIKNISKRLNDSRHSAISNVFGSEGTFCSFDICKKVSRRIDYIFTSENILVQDYAVFSDVVNQKYPSDHFPVFVNIKINRQ
jgi:endonuclease/exonuclease/phosphatase family metal-dependent hydrolase